MPEQDASQDYGSGTNFVLFAGKCSDYGEATGYLTCLIDEGIISAEGASRFSLHDIWKDSDIDNWFSGEEELKRTVMDMKLPERYFLGRAKVLDTNKLLRAMSSIESRYGLDSQLYYVSVREQSITP